jgi:hypothetical protein
MLGVFTLFFICVFMAVFSWALLYPLVLLSLPLLIDQRNETERSIRPIHIQLMITRKKKGRSSYSVEISFVDISPERGESTMEDRNRSARFGYTCFVTVTGVMLGLWGTWSGLDPRVPRFLPIFLTECALLQVVLTLPPLLVRRPSVQSLAFCGAFATGIFSIFADASHWFIPSFLIMIGGYYAMEQTNATSAR